MQNTIEEEQKNLIEMIMAREQKSRLEDTCGGTEAMAVDYWNVASQLISCKVVNSIKLRNLSNLLVFRILSNVVTYY